MEESRANLCRKPMLPPPPGTFGDREELIKHVRDFGGTQGYVVTIKKSRREQRVILGCDRGGVYRNRRKHNDSKRDDSKRDDSKLDDSIGKRKRKACSRLINCPFEAIGKKEDSVWVLSIKNGEHNHEPLNDVSEHPYCRRFTEEEVITIKEMTEGGVKPRQVLKALKQSNPQLKSTPRQLYNLKAKIRQGTLPETSIKVWRPNTAVSVDTSAAEGSCYDISLMVKIPNFIGGKFVESHASAFSDVVNPATEEIVSQVPSSSYEEFKDAVSAAKLAFPSWKSTSVFSRRRIIFKLHELILRDIDKVAMSIITEQGMTMKGAHADILHGLEVIEHACGNATSSLGEFIPNASNGIDTCSIREPLGVCAGICPSNFSSMVSLCMFLLAVTCGNTFVLKPSQKNPGLSLMLAALAMEAGLPPAVLNIVHGSNDIVNYICDDDEIKAIAFVGSTVTGMHLCSRAASMGKLVQANMGHTNFAVVMPDAFMDSTIDAVVAAGFSAAGNPCMSLNTLIFVGASSTWEKELTNRANTLKVNGGLDPKADLGPVISKEVKDRICRSVQAGVESGARLVLDGRYVVVPGYESGNFVGPTILCDVTTYMACYKEEILGPVLLCMQAGSLDEAITIINRNKFVHGASIFTTSAIAARSFQNDVEVGLVGINVPVPFSLPFSSTGPVPSFAGDLNSYGRTGVQFYTKIKTVAQQWKDPPVVRASSSHPSAPERDPSNRVHSAATSLTSSIHPPNTRDSPPIPTASFCKTPNHEISTIRTSAGNYPRQDTNVSGHLTNAAVPAIDKDSTNQGSSIVMEQASNRVYMPLLPSRNYSIDPSSESAYAATAATSSQDSDASFRMMKTNRVYIDMASQGLQLQKRDSSPLHNSTTGPHTVDSISSGRIYVPTVSIQRSSTMQPVVERLYVQNAMSQSMYNEAEMMRVHHCSEQGPFPDSEGM